MITSNPLGVLVVALILVAVGYFLEWRRALRRADTRDDALLDYLETENSRLAQRVLQLERTQDELTSMALSTTHPALREAQLSVRNGLRGEARRFDQRIEEQLTALDDDEYREELRAEIAAAFDHNPGLDPDDVLTKYFSEART